jgi:predicted dehydrogenase
MTEHRTHRPRVGFLGLGWIGRSRLEALVQSEIVEVAAMVEPVQAQAEQALDLAPEAMRCESLDHLLRQRHLDGVVIATPSAWHTAQTIACADAGLSVFCQKPLGRTAAETRQAVAAARRADRLLAVDLSYRFLRGIQTMRHLIQSGEIGHVYAVELAFHNAYGPDKAWFYDPVQAGGGCVIDLGIHLVDLALWILGFPRVTSVASRLYAHGQQLGANPSEVEDYAVAQIDLATGATVTLTCSWRLPVGYDAQIEASFYGTSGGLGLHNVEGSFYDFRVERYRGTARECLHDPPDAWGGRAAVAWAQRLATTPQYDPDIEHLIAVAEVLDAIYTR